MSEGEFFMASKKKDAQFLPDSDLSRGDSVFLDNDRYINEGLAGGNVFVAGGRKNIEEAIDFYDETPPNVNELDE